MAIARKFGNKVYKWQVPDLQAAAVGLPVQTTAVDRFNLDVDAWFGEACAPTIKNVVHHMKYIQNADMNRPILLSAEGHVFDGLHRLAKCLLDGLSTIACQQFEVNPAPYEAVDFEEFRRQKPLIADTLIWMEKNKL